MENVIVVQNMCCRTCKLLKHPKEFISNNMYMPTSKSQTINCSSCRFQTSELKRLRARVAREAWIDRCEKNKKI